jgi:ketosteroid isomerase-like protein
MRTRLILLMSLLLTSCVGVPPRYSEIRQQVADTETAFAKTMADRSYSGFQAFLSEETIFFGAKGAIRGKQAVAEKWKPFFVEASPPFSWKPETVEVLDSGTLALTSGPVFDPSGKQFGTFTSIWRLEAPNTWRIIFDKGCDVCDCPK